MAVQAFWHRIGLILLVVRYIDLEHGADQAIADRADVAPGGRKSVLDMWPQTVNEAHAHSQVGRVHHIKLQEVSQLFSLTSGVDSLMLNTSMSIVCSSSRFGKTSLF